MGAETNIGWCHHTFNIAWGCFAVSPGCDNCYAKTLAKRYGHDVFEADSHRRVFGDEHWWAPIKWNLAAAAAGERRRVFCSSMADVMDSHPQIVSQLPRLWELIRDTPCLDWLLLTKRHGRILRSLPEDWGDGYPNVWLGVSAENQEWAERRIPVLLRVPARVRWVSVEPMLDPVDLTRLRGFGTWRDVLGGRFHTGPAILADQPRLDWVVCGGESGAGRRPMQLDWARDLAGKAKHAGVPFYFKQISAFKSEQPSGIPDLDCLKEFPTAKVAA